MKTVKREVYFRPYSDKYEKKEKRDLTTVPQVKKQTKVGRQRKEKQQRVPKGK